MLVAPPLTLSALGLALWLLWPREWAITEENIGRIQKGMMRAEVEAILGGPARDDSGGARRMEDGDMIFRIIGCSEEEWIGNERSVVVYFRDGLVIRLRTFFVVPPPTVLQKVRSWLRV